ncbi:MAG: ATP-binding cassette domain-containing protein [Thermodesulfobacteriota bacterium]|nr:ATP-binding cassette domain-containing protein [Thermodesulfobacteriota bacterium]
MIKVEGLYKYFGHIAAIEDISFQVKKGEIAGFLGPNGSGKTTTMRILTGFFPPTLGKAEVAGYDILKYPLEAKKRIGYFPERSPLYPDKRVKSYIEFVAEVYGLKGKERNKQVDYAINACGLTNVASRLIGNLSKGYRQRVCMAQTIVHNPEVLILDEPTIGLDPEQVVEIRKLIKTLGEDKTVFLSTHILGEVSIICSRIIIISNGHILAEDTTENLTDRLEETSRTSVQIEGPVKDIEDTLKALDEIIDIKRGKEISPKICSFIIESKKEIDIHQTLTSKVTEKNWVIHELRPISLSVEDIFLKIVEEKDRG